MQQVGLLAGDAVRSTAIAVQTGAVAGLTGVQRSAAGATDGVAVGVDRSTAMPAVPRTVMSTV